MLIYQTMSASNTMISINIAAHENGEWSTRSEWTQNKHYRNISKENNVHELSDTDIITYLS